MIKKQKLLNNLFGDIERVSPNGRQKIIIEKVKERIEAQKFSNFEVSNIKNEFILSTHKSLSELNQSGLKKSSSQNIYISPNQTLSQIMDPNGTFDSILDNQKGIQKSTLKPLKNNQTMSEKNLLSKVLSQSMEKLRELEETEYYQQNMHKPSLKKDPKREVKRQRIVQQFFHQDDFKNKEDCRNRDSKSPINLQDKSFKVIQNEGSTKVNFYNPSSPKVKSFLAPRERSTSKKLEELNNVDKGKIQNSLEQMKKSVINRSLQQLFETQVFVEDQEKPVELNRQSYNVNLNKFELSKPSVNQDYDGEASRKINQDLNFISQSKGRLSKFSKDDISFIKESIQQLQVTETDLQQIASKSFKSRENLFKKRSFSEKKEPNESLQKKKPQYYNKWYIPTQCWGIKKPEVNNKTELLQNLSKNPDYFYQNIYTYKKDNPLTVDKIDNDPRYIKLQLLQNQLMKNQMAKKLKKHLEDKQIRVPNYLQVVNTKIDYL